MSAVVYVSEPADSFLKQEIETVSIVNGEGDGLAGIAPEKNMIESIGKMDALFACHGFKDTATSLTYQLGSPMPL